MPFDAKQEMRVMKNANNVEEIIDDLNNEQDETLNSEILTDTEEDDSRHNHVQLDNDEKWFLSTGKCVDDELFIFGKQCNFDHPSKSKIIDIDDKNYDLYNVFTLTEINEIRTFKPKPLPVLPKDIKKILNQFNIEEQITTQQAREERELPLEIASFLDETTNKYYHVEWAVAEEINESFIPKLKQFTVDTTQVVNAHYKGAETCRLHWRAATEILEQLLTIKSGGLSAEEANQLLDEALESAKRLAIHAWVQGRQQDEEAKDYAIRALRLPPSLKHLEAKESGSKREAFSEEFIARYNEVNYQQRILKAEITSTSAGRGRGGRGSYGRGGTKNYFGGGDVGPQPSTTTVIPIIITIQHQQTIQHRELPVSNGTQITTLTAAISINTTDSTTINTIEPYYNLNNELHHPLRWHCTGQSPITFSPLLENNNQSSLAPISNSKWLQDPTFQETDPMEESKEGEDSRRSIILSAKQYRNSWMEGR
ncbi:hypothetical protein G6F46_004389 [Rhizopus delemar]|nr:hypothetical protein G6F48_009007 [Rhizopus delemar]KAG1617818.1 hypothetical protein G6F46_004389 [Rhizopus delemar]KAG1635730.1 hypothetical protein G6F44_009734 [Rhizopus delemar]